MYYNVNTKYKLYYTLLLVICKESPKGRLAQLVEQRIYTAKVGGSNPSSPTENNFFFKK